MKNKIKSSIMYLLISLPLVSYGSVLGVNKDTQPKNISKIFESVIPLVNRVGLAGFIYDASVINSSSLSGGLDVSLPRINGDNKKAAMVCRIEDGAVVKNRTYGSTQVNNQLGSSIFDKTNCLLTKFNTPVYLINKPLFIGDSLRVSYFSKMIVAGRDLNFDCDYKVNELFIDKNGSLTNNMNLKMKIVFKQKNILKIVIKNDSTIYINNQSIELSEVSKYVTEFLENNGGLGYGQKTCYYCQGAKNPSSSEHPNKAYLKIYNYKNNRDLLGVVYKEIQKSYLLLWNRVANNLYDLDFNSLYCEKKNFIRNQYFPVNIIYTSKIDWNASSSDALEFTAKTSTVQIGKKKVEIPEAIAKEEELDVPITIFSFSTVEIPPVFRACTGTIARKKVCVYSFINDLVARNFNLEVPKKLGLSKGVKNMMIRFVIDENGLITNISVRSMHPLLTKEAIRVIKLLPKMKAGKQHNRNVRVRYNYRLSYTIE